MEERKAFRSEAAWWRSLTWREKIYMGYFVMSFLLLFTTGGGVVWMAAVVANFANAARMVKRVSVDGLEEE